MVLYVLAKRIATRTKTDLDDRLLIATRKYVYLLVYLFGAVSLLDYCEAIGVEYLGEKIFGYADGIVYAMGVFLVSRLLVKLISTVVTWYGTNMAAKTETAVD